MKKVVEGYLYCSPYVGDYWFLTKEPTLIEVCGKPPGTIELPKQSINDIDIPLEEFEKKKVKITIEEI